jgi:hypothetical protein
VRPALHQVGVWLLLVAVTLVRADVAPSRIIDDPRQQRGGAFGSALAFVDGALAVGAPGAPVFDLDGAGVVQLFTTDGVLVRTVTAAVPVAGAGLGSTMAAADGLLYASAPNDVPFGVGGIGAVYVFDAATGALLRIVRAPDPDASTAPVGGTSTGGGLPASSGPSPIAMGFGRALAVTAVRLIVGAPDSTVDGVPGAGAVYVYDLEGALVRTLREFSPSENARFGAAVAVADDRLLVGVPGARAGGADGAGVVRVFDLATGASIRTLSVTIAVEGAALGASVGVIDGSIFAGAPGDDVLGVAAGAVYLFDADGFALRRIVTPPLPEPGLDFGLMVVVSGGDLLVGADGATVLDEAQAGKAFLVDPTTAAVRTIFEPTRPRTGGHFGLALAVAGATVAIGQPDLTSDIGRAYLFAPAGAPRASGAPPAVGSGATGASCPQAATAASVECRLAAVPNVGGRLERALGRALQETRRAGAARGARRARAFRRAARGVHALTRALARRGMRLGVSADRRDALLAAASSMEADLLALASGR